MKSMIATLLVIGFSFSAQAESVASKYPRIVLHISSVQFEDLVYDSMMRANVFEYFTSEQRTSKIMVRATYGGEMCDYEYMVRTPVQAVNFQARFNGTFEKCKARVARDLVLDLKKTKFE